MDFLPFRDFLGLAAPYVLRDVTPEEAIELKRPTPVRSASAANEVTEQEFRFDVES